LFEAHPEEADYVTRFHKLKMVGGASVVAIVAAAVVFGSTSLASVPGPLPGRLLTSGTDFSISSTFYTTPSGVYPTTACSGTPALLYPGVIRCAIFTVRNHLSVPITVGRISTALDVRFPTPPAVCAGSYLALPAFSGAIRVRSGQSADSPGVPITLRDSGSNQDVCENFTYHFVYWGSARRTVATTTTLASAPNPSAFGSPVTLKAAVTSSSGSEGLNGTVSFYLGTPRGAHTLIGKRALTASGRVNLISSWLPAGTDKIYAGYTGATFSASTSSIIDQEVIKPSGARHGDSLHSCSIRKACRVGT
jgi:hypothetical protein